VSNKSEKVRITVDLDPELHLKVRIKAVQQRVHLTDVLRQLLSEWVKDAPPDAASQHTQK